MSGQRNPPPLRGIIVPEWTAPLSEWRRQDLEQAYSIATLKLIQIEAENANLYALLSEQLIRTAGPIGDRETMPAPAPDGCERCESTGTLPGIPSRLEPHGVGSRPCDDCDGTGGRDEDDEKTEETNWLAVAEGD